MKVKDITQEWADANERSSDEFGDSPNDAIDWKSIRSEGFDAVSVGGVVHAYCKHGLLDPVSDDSNTTAAPEEAQQ